MIHHTIQNFKGKLSKPSHVSVVYGNDWRCIRFEERSSGKSVYDFKETPVEELDDLLNGYKEAKLKLAFISERFALIPNSAFGYDKVEELGVGHFFKEKEEELNVDSVYNQNLKNIYVPNGRGKDLHGVQRFHLISPILSFLPKSKDRVYLFHLGAEAVFAAFRGGELQRIKVVSGLTEDAALYHVVETFEGAGLHPHQHELYLAGRVLPDSTLAKLLGRFVQKINFLNIPGWTDNNAHIFYDVYLLSKYF